MTNERRAPDPSPEEMELFAKWNSSRKTAGGFPSNT